MLKPNQLCWLRSFDEEWSTLRWRRNDSPLRKFLVEEAHEARGQSVAPHVLHECYQSKKRYPFKNNYKNNLPATREFSSNLKEHLGSYFL